MQTAHFFPYLCLNLLRGILDVLLRAPQERRTLPLLPFQFREVCHRVLGSKFATVSFWPVAFQIGPYRGVNPVSLIEPESDSVPDPVLLTSIALSQRADVSDLAMFPSAQVADCLANVSVFAQGPIGRLQFRTRMNDQGQSPVLGYPGKFNGQSRSALIPS